MLFPNVGKTAIVFLALCGMCWAPPARAQAPPAAQTGPANLAEIRVTGSKRWTSEQIASSCGLTPGEPVTREDFQTAANHLSELGTFSNVQYRFSMIAKGALVEFQVVDAPLIPVSYDNMPWFSDETITAAVHQDVPLFDGYAPSQGTVLGDISKAIAKLVWSLNIHPSVEHSVVRAIATDEDIQRFRVVGVPVTVTAIEFDDPIARESAAIRERLSDVVGKPYSRLSIELFDYEQVRPIYLASAMLRVKIGKPEPSAEASSPGVPASSVRVKIPIVPGAVYMLGGITWTGNRAIPTSALDELVAPAYLKVGAPADGLRLHALWESVNDKYGRAGYLDEKLDPVQEFDDQAHRVSYGVAIAEGLQYHMGNLILTGLSVEGEKRIRTGFRLKPGDPLDRIYCDEFADTGARAAFGTLPFHYEKLGHFLEKDPQKGTADVMLDFQ
jgi:hypothetical protein